MNTQDYIELRAADSSATPIIILNMTLTLLSEPTMPTVLAKTGLPLNYLLPQDPRKARFYLLPKIHKPQTQADPLYLVMVALQSAFL